MPPTIQKRLASLSAKARDSGAFQICVAADAAAADPNNLDLQINIVGALHEAGSLPNSINPYWKEWRSDASAWIGRCIERIKQNDSDYWALAALLGTDARECCSGLSDASFSPLSFYFYDRYDKPTVHVGVFALRTADAVWAPVLEVGFDTDALEVVDVRRWRAVTVDEMTEHRGSATGQGSGSYYMRALLPYGCWRILHTDLVIQPEWIVPRPDFI